MIASLLSHDEILSLKVIMVCSASDWANLAQQLRTRHILDTVLSNNLEHSSTQMPSQGCGPCAFPDTGPGLFCFAGGGMSQPLGQSPDLV